MKYLNDLAKLRVFTFGEFTNLVGNSNAAKKTIQSYIDKGYVKRIKRNLYSTISLETDEPLASKFLVGTHINENSFVSHHSAFEFYGYYFQVSHAVNVSSTTKFHSFDFEGNTFSYINSPFVSFVDEIRGVKVTSIERTVVDSIKDSGKYSELEETLKCIKLLPYISIKDIQNYLAQFGCKMLYKKVGIVLSLFAKQFSIPKSFFEKCHEASDSVRGYFDFKSRSSSVYNAEWGIYIDKDFSTLLRNEKNNVQL